MESEKRFEEMKYVMKQVRQLQAHPFYPIMNHQKTVLHASCSPLGASKDRTDMTGAGNRIFYFNYSQMSLTQLV